MPRVSRINELLKFTDPETFKTTSIWETKIGYAVTYQGTPINVWSVHEYDPDAKPWWRDCIYASEVYAKNACKKLNTQFKTDQFQVQELILGDKIEDDAK